MSELFRIEPVVLVLSSMDMFQVERVGLDELNVRI
jgi:hypothetical protein